MRDMRRCSARRPARALTAERIRDKVAASRRKGMWMGGVPPFGYRVDISALRVARRRLRGRS
jgi:DNA invertase Pin-like site-specific DNA recombinase